LSTTLRTNKRAIGRKKEEVEVKLEEKKEPEVIEEEAAITVLSNPSRVLER